MEIEKTYIDSLLVDVYHCAATRQVFGTITLHDYLTSEVCPMTQLKERVDYMRSITNIDDRKAYKSQYIPAVTLSCTCDTYRGKDNIKTVNPIICLDFDYHDGVDENTFLSLPDKRREFMTRLLTLPYIYSVGSSCGGVGVYAIVVLSSTDIEGHFYALQQDFALANITIDKACHDTTRLRIASYDDIMITEREMLTCYDKVYHKQIEKRVQPYRNPLYNVGNTEEQILEEVIDMICDSTFSVSSYNEWLRLCFNCCALGTLGYNAFHKISENSPSFTGSADVDKKWKSCQNSSITVSADNAKLYFFALAKEYIGKNWKYRVLDNIKQKKERKLN